MDVDKKETTENLTQLESACNQKCRICLLNCDRFFQLFQSDDNLPQKIMALAFVQIEHSDGLPSVICFSCHQLLDMSYSFKCQVEKSDAALRKTLVNKIKINQASLSQSIDNFEVQCKSQLLYRKDANHVVSYGYDNKQNLAACEINEKCRSSKRSIEVRAEKNRYHELCNQKHIKHDSDSEVLLKEEKVVTKSKLIDKSIKQEELFWFDESDTSQGKNNRDDDGIIFGSGDLKLEFKNNSFSKVEEESKLEIMNRQISTEEINDSYEDKPLNLRLSRLKCPRCFKSFATDKEVQTHMTIHKSNTKLRYTCYWCEKQFLDIAQMMNHISNNHDSSYNDHRDGVSNNHGRVITDRKADKLDKDIGGLIRKQIVKKKDYKLKCKFCMKQFTYKKSFLSHIETHSKDKRSETPNNHAKQSEKMEKSLKHKNDLSDSRMNESDVDDLPLDGLQCIQRSKHAETKKNLKRHILTHSNSKFNYSICGKDFKQLDKLKNHKQSKHKEEIFGPSDDKGDDTDNEGKSSDGMESRSKKKNWRPHQCVICEKTFIQPQSLANHMERHKLIEEPQKSFTCEICSKCFAQSGSLVAHMDTHRRIKLHDV